MRQRVSAQNPLVLGSRSARRAQLLEQCGIPFEVFATEIDERLQPGERPDALATRLARQKGAATVAAFQRSGRDPSERWFLCADTIVHVQGELLGKPRDEQDGRRMLRLLSGRTHHVTTGFVIHSADVFDAPVYAESTAVTFRPISEAEVQRYVASREGMDKAGGYAIQGLASAFCERIEGSYANVVGLPVHRVIEVLLDIGALEAYPL
jgi:septum formation protein